MKYCKIDNVRRKIEMLKVKIFFKGGSRGRVRTLARNLSLKILTRF